MNIQLWSTSALLTRQENSCSPSLHRVLIQDLTWGQARGVSAFGFISRLVCSPWGKECQQAWYGLGLGEADVESIRQGWSQVGPGGGSSVPQHHKWLCAVRHLYGFCFRLNLRTREANDEKIPLTFLCDWNALLSPMSSAIWNTKN